MIGNALEVVECIEILHGAGPDRSCANSASNSPDGCFISAARRNPSQTEKQQSAKLISSGKALEKFRQMIELQGGDARVIDDVKQLPQAQHTMQVAQFQAGYFPPCSASRSAPPA